MGNVSREMETQKKKKIKSKCKRTFTKINNNFNGLIGRQNMANDRISELKYMSIETYQTEIQREKLLKKKKQPPLPNRKWHPITVVQFQKTQHILSWKLEKKKRAKQKKYLK